MFCAVVDATWDPANSPARPGPELLCSIASPPVMREDLNTGLRRRAPECRQGPNSNSRAVDTVVLRNDLSARSSLWVSTGVAGLICLARARGRIDGVRGP